MFNINLRTVRNQAFAAGVFGAMALSSLGVMGTAEARVPDSAEGSLADTCFAIQVGFDGAQAKYQAATTDAERAKYQAQMGDAIDTWYHAGCGNEFGSLIDFRIDGNSGSGQATVGGNKSQDPSGVSPKPVKVTNTRGISSH